MATKRETKPKGRHGGPRPGSGRKPKPAEALKREIADRLDDAEYAFGLFRDTMRDENRALDVRLDCAKEVLDRVLGKPRQAIDQRTTGDLTIRVEYAGQDPDPDAPEAPPGPA